MISIFAIIAKMVKGPEKIEGYGNRKNFDLLTIVTKRGETGVNPQGGYVTSWKVKNPHTHLYQDVLYQGNWIDRNGIPPLFPNFGKGGEVAPFHGVGMDKTSIWKIEELSRSKATIKLTPANLSEENRSAYPYDFETDITTEIEQDGSLVYAMKVKNNGSEAMPISPGIHPYWPVEHDKKAEVTTTDIPGFDASVVDWANDPPDTAYPFDGKAEIQLPDKKITIEDISPRGRVIKMLKVWSQVPSEQNLDFNFICFEPITGDNFAIEEDPITVPPNGEWEMRLKFSVEFNTE